MNKKEIGLLLDRINSICLKNRYCIVFDGVPFTDSDKSYKFTDLNSFIKDFDLELNKIRNLYLIRKKHTSITDPPFIHSKEYAVVFQNLSRYIDPFCKEINDLDKSKNPIAVLSVLKNFYYTIPFDTLIKMKTGVTVSTLSNESKHALGLIANYFYIFRESGPFNAANQMINNEKGCDFLRDAAGRVFIKFEYFGRPRSIPLGSAGSAIQSSNMVTDDPVFDITTIKYVLSLGELEDWAKKNYKIQININSGLEYRRIIVLGDKNLIPKETLLRGISSLLGIVFKNKINSFEMSHYKVPTSNDIQDLRGDLLKAIPNSILSYAKTPILPIEVRSEIVDYPDINKVLNQAIKEKREYLIEITKQIRSISKHIFEYYLDINLKQTKNDTINFNALSQDAQSSFCLYLMSDILTSINSNFIYKQQYTIDREKMIVKFELVPGSKQRPLANFEIVSPDQSSGGTGAFLADLWLHDPQNAPKISP
ncbi:hypothetical protein [Armatimonas sp.]|uniref:hypothetical protein n=1 Tax=Armatimonas sp. TaxID=1872638 RepID=UPI0037505E2F